MDARLLRLIRAARRRRIPSRILSNGILADEARSRELVGAGVQIVQVSLDGDEERHDAIRGTGTFKRAMAGVEALSRAGIEVTVAATMSRRNVSCVEAIAEAASRAGARRLSYSRLVPCGAGAALKPEMFRPGEWFAAQRRMLDAARRQAIELPLRDPTWTALLSSRKRARSCRGISGCAVGYNGLALDADGTVYPCRRLPISLGNILERSFDDIWLDEKLQALRDRDRLKGRCGRCDWRWNCGGCRAIPYALNGDYLAEDLQCPYGQNWLKDSFRRLAAGRILRRYWS